MTYADALSNAYWTSTMTNDNRLAIFSFGSGWQDLTANFNGPYHIWPVMDGDVAPDPVIPEPTTILLLGSGLLGLVGFRRKRTRI